MRHSRLCSELISGLRGSRHSFRRAGEWGVRADRVDQLARLRLYYVRTYEQDVCMTLSRVRHGRILNLHLAPFSPPVSCRSEDSAARDTQGWTRQIQCNSIQDPSDERRTHGRYGYRRVYAQFRDAHDVAVLIEHKRAPTFIPTRRAASRTSSFWK